MRVATPAPRYLAPRTVVCAAPKPAVGAPSTAAPTQALLDAFAILRRPRTDQDALSAQALQALRVRGLAPVAPDSARLLRSTPSGGRAWVVPVPTSRRAWAALPLPGPRRARAWPSWPPGMPRAAAVERSRTWCAGARP